MNIWNALGGKEDRTLRVSEPFIGAELGVLPRLRLALHHHVLLDNINHFAIPHAVLLREARRGEPGPGASLRERQKIMKQAAH